MTNHSKNNRVTFEQAQLLKLVGFNDRTLLDFYNINGQLNDHSTRTDIRYQAPTLTDAIDWLRTEKNFDISIVRDYSPYTYVKLYSIHFHFVAPNDEVMHYTYRNDLETYPSAQSAALDAALHIVLSN